MSYVPYRLTMRCHNCHTGITLRCHMCRTGITLRCHMCLIAITLKYHMYRTGITLRCHMCRTGLTLRCRMCRTCIILRCHICRTGITLRCHMCRTSLTLRCHMFRTGLTLRCQIVYGPTHARGGTHDLLMTDVPDQVLVAVVAPIGNTDHYSLPAVISIALAVSNLCVFLTHQVNQVKAHQVNQHIKSKFS